jgi:hypothetical protein
MILTNFVSPKKIILLKRTGILLYHTVLFSKLTVYIVNHAEGVFPGILAEIMTMHYQTKKNFHIEFFNDFKKISEDILKFRLEAVLSSFSKEYEIKILRQKI